MTQDIYASLTPAQLAAVRHVEGPMLTLAGPGSGKTRVVTHRIAHLIASGVDPREILALTFTNKAADEMRQRLQTLAPKAPVWMGTFHRFCARLLRRYANLVGLEDNYSIYDTEDSGKHLRRTIEETDVAIGNFTPDQIGRAISWAKNELVTPDTYEPRFGDPLGRVVKEIYPHYQRRLLEANAVDFDDLLLHVTALLRGSEELRDQLDRRHRFILVDEYQDTNFPQYMILRALSNHYPNLAVTGDPDQAIYGWRGANLRNILDFESEYPEVKVVRLEQNYRSTKKILSAAHKLISHNIHRKNKELFTNNDEGEEVVLATYPTHFDEARNISQQIATARNEGRSLSDIAILYRVNALSRVMEHALREQQLPYQIVNGHEFYKRREIRDVLAYLRLLYNPADNNAFLRVINTPTRGIGATSLAHLRDYALKHRLPLLEAAREATMIDTLKKPGRNALLNFVAIWDDLAKYIAEPIEAIIGYLLTATGYGQMLQQSTLEEDQARYENVQELLSAAHAFDAANPEGNALGAYLEQAALVSDTDVWDGESEAVSLMTLHSAKGLEFPVVFIIAVEEGLLPHERSLKDEMQLEEERRLFFVGMTRAEEKLQISNAGQRLFRGVACPTVPSSFFYELPLDEMQKIEPVESSYYFEHSHQSNEVEMVDPVQDDEVHFQQDEAVVRKEKPKMPAELTSKLMTGADLLAKGAPKRYPIHAFKQGGMVDHPEYGTGVIVAISGKNAKRTAAVHFEDADEPISFRLQFAELTPLDDLR